MKNVNVPVIASGGMGKLEHIESLINETSIDAIAFSHCLHYNKYSIEEIREFCIKKKFPVRILNKR